MSKEVSVSSAAVNDIQEGSNAPASLPVGRRAALVEVGCLILLVETIMWIVPLMPAPKADYGGFAIMILALLIVSQLRDRATPRELGFRFDNFFATLGLLCGWFLPFFLVIVGVGALAGSLRFGQRFFGMLVSVPLWALLQQYMLLVFVHRRFRVATGDGARAAICTTCLFAAMHLPNPVLTVACAIAGAVWAWTYERSPNLFANALTHTIGSALVANSLPHWLLKNMVVGYNHLFR